MGSTCFAKETETDSRTIRSRPDRSSCPRCRTPKSAFGTGSPCKDYSGSAARVSRVGALDTRCGVLVWNRKNFVPDTGTIVQHERMQKVLRGQLVMTFQNTIFSSLSCHTLMRRGGLTPYLAVLRGRKV